jgi:hypothetical protein
MPKNPTTRKIDCHMLSADYILAFCIAKAEKKYKHKEEHEEKKHTEKDQKAQVKKGKWHTQDFPNPGKPETSRSVLLPLTALAGLGALNLESGGSSAANTPDNSPAIVS